MRDFLHGNGARFRYYMEIYMYISAIRKNNIGLFSILLFLSLSLFCFTGCAGKSDSNGDNSGGDVGTEEGPAEVWEGFALGQTGEGGLLSPRVTAVVDSNEYAHIFYFDKNGKNDTPYGINYLVWDIKTSSLLSVSEPESVIEVDNCSALSLALDTDNSPVVAYQGGIFRECGPEKQSDVMLSVKENEAWAEYTGATGIVKRNPVLPDGLAGTEVSVAVDSKGGVHLCYQFFYEGCDAMNFRYPDLQYVKKDSSALDAEVSEETVEGNIYEGSNMQNSVGEHAVITLDSHEDPAIFYYAEFPDGTNGLRVARRKNGEWIKEWVEKDCVVGDISAALSTDGYLAVAYYVKQYTDGRDDVDCLMYAKEESSSWVVRMVDDTTRNGKYCSLAFDPSGSPAIAYYEIESYSGRGLEDLKLARFNGKSWDREVVASTGNIGLYNTLWFDNDNPVIISYSNTDKTIYIFYQ
ncbi:MAG: hypothetical protein ACC630_08130, partial [Nitrospinota bacterium]